MKKSRTKFLYKIAYPYTISFSIVLFVILSLVYFMLLSSHETEKKLTNQMLINQPLKQIETFIADMDSVAYKVMTNEFIINKFALLREEADPKNHFNKNILDAIDTGSTLTNINGRYAPKWRIAAYNDWGDLISTGAITEKHTVDIELSSSDVKKLIERFENEEIDYNLISPQTDRWASYFKSKYFSLQRPIMNIYSSDIVGIVEIQENIKSLESKLKFDSNVPLFVNLYDADNQSIILQANLEEYRIVASAVSEKLNWKIDLLEPRDFLNNERLYGFAIMIAIWIFLTGLTAIIINRIARSVTKPLVKLENQVNEISVTNPGKIDTSEVEIDEIFQVTNAFNNLLELHAFSVNQEKKSFLFAMQAQMNPHFLYNVLSIITAAAIENNSKAVVNISKNLAEILRYSSSFENNLATLEVEIQQTKAYLELMKARYEEMFSYSIYMDENLKSIEIPKLIIQPLCENCFKHAFSSIEPPYRIDIKVINEEDSWIIEVNDNGIGFSEEARNSAMDKANKASYSDLSQMQIGGLGIRSSILRLKLYHHKNVHCNIENLQSCGSKITLKISHK